MLGRRGTRYGAGAAVMILLALGVRRLRQCAVLAAQRPVGLHGEPAEHAVAPDRPGAEDPQDARRGDRVLPHRHAGQAHGGGPARPVRRAIGRKVHLAPRGHGQGAGAGPRVRGRELRHGGDQGRGARRGEDGEDSRRRGGEAHQCPRQGDALGEADRLRDQGAWRARGDEHRAGRVQPGPRPDGQGQLRGQGAAPRPRSPRCPTTPRW